VCNAGRCTFGCGPGQIGCLSGGAPVCVNPQTDNANCGFCNNVCNPPDSCITGSCQNVSDGGVSDGG